MSDFEEDYTSAIYLAPNESNIDNFLNPVDSAIGGPRYVRVRKLLDSYKNSKPFFEQPPGTRVSLHGDPADLVLHYPSTLPALDSVGTIVTVKAANGNTTFHEGRLFVKWDSGEFGAYLPEHLNLVGARQNKNAFSLDLTDFLKTSNEGELVHKSTRDLWAFETGEDGKPLIYRLFDESGEPIKI